MLSHSAQPSVPPVIASSAFPVLQVSVTGIFSKVMSVILLSLPYAAIIREYLSLPPSVISYALVSTDAATVFSSVFGNPYRRIIPQRTGSKIQCKKLFEFPFVSVKSDTVKVYAVPGSKSPSV